MRRGEVLVLLHLEVTWGAGRGGLRLCSGGVLGGRRGGDRGCPFEDEALLQDTE